MSQISVNKRGEGKVGVTNEESITDITCTVTKPYNVAHNRDNTSRHWRIFLKIKLG